MLLLVFGSCEDRGELSVVGPVEGASLNGTYVALQAPGNLRDSYCFRCRKLLKIVTTGDILDQNVYDEVFEEHTVIWTTLVSKQCLYDEILPIIVKVENRMYLEFKAVSLVVKRKLNNLSAS
jgi:hypothetical protein